MAKYSELVKNLDHALEYIRHFYVFGYQTRSEFQNKSARSYDTESRRIRSWLNDFVLEQRSAGGKNISLPIDSADQPRNPLYAIWESKSFTRNDVLLHFFLLNLLSDGCAYTVEELADALLARYGELFDVSTLRNKLREYADEGLFLAERTNRCLRYQCSSQTHSELLNDPLYRALDFFTEVAPFGEIGSFIQNETGHKNTLFRFKHDYIVHTLEDENLLLLLNAMHEKRQIMLASRHRAAYRCTPIKILASTQNGRRYLCSVSQYGKIRNHRLDRLGEVTLLGIDSEYEQKCELVDAFLPYLWGASIRDRLDTVTMRIRVNLPSEEYILRRIEREGRNGRIEPETNSIFRYSITVSDASEMIPFLRSFIGRIVSLECSDPSIVTRFKRDFKRSCAQYECNAQP